MNEWQVPAMGSVGLLYVLSLLCFLGLICKNYRENWFQALGLIGLIIWALGRASVLDDRTTVSFYQFFGHLCLVLFGIGTGWKVWKYRR
jgi:hypothetical protein